MASGDNKTTGLNSINLDLNGLKINDVAVTSTAAELNALDGITASVAELNKLHGAGSAVASGTQQTLISDPSSGSTGDAEARTAINTIIDALQAFGIVATS
jgi:hypothetical protein